MTVLKLKKFPYIEKYKDEIITIKYGGNIFIVGKYLIISLVTYQYYKN